MFELQVSVDITGTSSVIFNRYRDGSRRNPRKDDNIYLQRGYCIDHFFLTEKGKQVYVPGQAIFMCLRSAGMTMKWKRRYLTKSKITSLIPGYLSVLDQGCVIKDVNGNVVTEDSGWSVDARTYIGGMEVTVFRPLIEAGWSLTFTVRLLQPDVFGEVGLRKLIEKAGVEIGLLAERPEKKGPHGKFKISGWRMFPEVVHKIPAQVNTSE